MIYEKIEKPLLLTLLVFNVLLGAFHLKHVEKMRFILEKIHFRLEDIVSE